MKALACSETEATKEGYVNMMTIYIFSNASIYRSEYYDLHPAVGIFAGYMIHAAYNSTADDDMVSIRRETRVIRIASIILLVSNEDINE